MKKEESDACWWCGSGRKQSCGHLLGGCRAWKREWLALKKRVEKISGKKRKCGQRRSERGARLKVVDLFRDERPTEAVLEFLARSLQRCRRSRRLSDAVRTSVEARLCEVNSPPPATFIWSIRRDMNLQILREDEQYASHVKHHVQYPHLSFSFTFYLVGLSLDQLTSWNVCSETP
jgi:hypothetical protein